VYRLSERLRSIISMNHARCRALTFFPKQRFFKRSIQSPPLAHPNDPSRYPNQADMDKNV
jgi:hypothetical protein